jgi:hypothetical protein
MIKHLEWFERRFDFDSIPVWMYPNILERLRGTPARCAAIVERVSPAARVRRDSDKWSIQENIGHLLDLEELLEKRLDDFEMRKETLTAADLENVKTHGALHNAAQLDTILADFARKRAVSVKRFEGFNDDAVNRAALHPRLQTPMRPLDLAFFFAEHDDHHMAVISGLVRKFK